MVKEWVVSRGYKTMASWESKSQDPFRVSAFGIELTVMMMVMLVGTGLLIEQEKDIDKTQDFPT